MALYNFKVSCGDKSSLNFWQCHAAKGVVVEVETDVAQLVEVAEDAHLRKLGHSGDEDELQPGVGIFQYGIEGGQRFAEIVLQFGVVEGAE